MAMKKFINDPANLTAELLDGLCTAFSDKLTLVSEKLVCRVPAKDADKVAIVTLGGSGHEPALQAFVGEGLIDISVVGDIFAAPNGPKVFEALKLMNREAGILFVVLNHAGDVLNANIAMEMAEEEGLNVKMILTHEDIAPGADAPDEDKRGLVGCVPLYKVAGAAAEAGKSLDEVYGLAGRRLDGARGGFFALGKGVYHTVPHLPALHLCGDIADIDVGMFDDHLSGQKEYFVPEVLVFRVVYPEYPSHSDVDEVAEVEIESPHVVPQLVGYGIVKRLEHCKVGVSGLIAEELAFGIVEIAVLEFHLWAPEGSCVPWRYFL